VLITRIGIIVAIVATVILAYVLPVGIIAAATAIFFGLCASAFLPMLVGGLFTRRMTKAAAIASLCAGFGVSFFWLMFVQQVKGRLPAILANVLLGKPTILPDPIAGIHWNWIEALFVALPVSAIVAVVVTLFTRPESKEHLDRCFKGVQSQ
jgi:SSS family solute:Na+ symporter